MRGRFQSRNVLAGMTHADWKYSPTRRRLPFENARLHEQTVRDATTKAVLLREANHGVKNNLAAIAGLLFIHQRFASGPNEDFVQTIVQRLVGQIQGLSAAHSMLTSVEWQSPLVTDLVSRAIHSALQQEPHTGPVFVEITPATAVVDPQYVGDLALVIHELTTNTLKHALSERDSVRICLSVTVEDAEVVALEFRDDGPGFPDDVLAGERRGMGLYLVQNLVCGTMRGDHASNATRQGLLPDCD